MLAGETIENPLAEAGIAYSPGVPLGMSLTELISLFINKVKALPNHSLTSGKLACPSD